MTEIPEMLTVKETEVRYGLRGYFVRRMVADGCVVSVRSGRKILINAASVTRYLETGVPQGSAFQQAAPQTENAPRIVPIPLR